MMKIIENNAFIIGGIIGMVFGYMYFGNPFV